MYYLAHSYEAVLEVLCAQFLHNLRTLADAPMELIENAARMVTVHALVDFGEQPLEHLHGHLAKTRVIILEVTERQRPFFDGSSPNGFR